MGLDWSFLQKNTCWVHLDVDLTLRGLRDLNYKDYFIWFFSCRNKMNLWLIIVYTSCLILHRSQITDSSNHSVLAKTNNLCHIHMNIHSLLFICWLPQHKSDSTYSQNIVAEKTKTKGPPVEKSNLQIWEKRQHTATHMTWLTADLWGSAGATAQPPSVQHQR